MFTIFQLLHDLSLTESVLWRQGAEHRYAACNLANGPIQAGVLYLGAPAGVAGCRRGNGRVFAPKCTAAPQTAAQRVRSGGAGDR